MTETEMHTPQAEGARHIESEAANWLQRQQFWKWTSDDQAQFDAWLSQTTAHRIAYVRVSEAWNRTHRLTILRPPLSRGVSTQTGRKFPSLFKAIAAAFAICVMGSGAYLYMSPPRERVIATAVGEHRLVTLPDGSTIELNTDTAIRLSQVDGTRSIKLDRGEAYFDVRHDDTRPFTVTVGTRRLTDLGTKFVVHAEPNRLDISVVEGRVLFDAQQDSGRKIALLTAGDKLVATANEITRSKEALPELSAQLGWRRGVLVFKNTPLVEAIAEFNRYHDRKLVISDAHVARMTIGGTFATDNIAAFTEVAQDVLGLHAVTRGNETMLSRK